MSAAKRASRRASSTADVTTSRRKGLVHGYATRGKRIPEYGVWNGIKSRCYIPTTDHYDRYGGRGIRACERWRSDFVAFLQDMGRRPSDKHSIDRKDSDLHYSCGKCDECQANGWGANCRWSTQADQLRNWSRNRLITHAGETLCVMDWAARTGIHRATICDRLDHGWSIERALTTPRAPLNRCNVRLFTFNGETLSISEWARKLGLKVSTLTARINSGWSLERALAEPTGQSLPRSLRKTA